MRVVGVIQARSGSTRLPGKVMEPIGDRPLLAWTVGAMSAVPSLAALIVATTVEPSDDRLAAYAATLGPVHRGPTRDVLTRVLDAVRPFRPDLVVRQTADNPFVDPDVVERQVRLAIEGGFDYVGASGWPLGIAGEVARMVALEEAGRDASEAAEREHVMPFLYTHPERFRIHRLAAETDPAHDRYTVDTAEDLAFARALADRLGHPPPVRLAELEAIVLAEPSLAELNTGVRQKSWQEAESPHLRQVEET